MRKFTVCIHGSHEIINLNESLLNINHLYVKKPTIFWEYKNVKENILNGPGYYSIYDIKKLMPTNTDIIAYKNTGKCVIVNNTGSPLTLDKNVSKLLGFNSTVFTNIKTESDNKVSMNNGIKYIKVRCNSIDSSHSINETGLFDKILITLAVTSSMSLFGSVQTFDDIESKVPIHKGVLNQLEFTVTDQDDRRIDIGSILLDLYLI